MFSFTPPIYKDHRHEDEKDIQPDIILLDVVMPEVDGGDVATGLRSRSATKKIPIIFRLCDGFAEGITLRLLRKRRRALPRQARNDRDPLRRDRNCARILALSYRG